MYKANFLLGAHHWNSLSLSTTAEVSRRMRHNEVRMHKAGRVKVILAEIRCRSRAGPSGDPSELKYSVNKTLRQVINVKYKQIFNNWEPTQ